MDNGDIHKLALIMRVCLNTTTRTPREVKTNHQYFMALRLLAYPLCA